MANDIQKNPRPDGSTRRRRSHGSMAMAVASSAALWGCNVLDQLVDVDAPSRIVAETLEAPGNAATLMAGAVGDFECAFGHYVAAAAAMTQEFQYAQGGFGWRSYDQRDIETSGFNAAYVNSTCTTPQQGVIPGVYKTLSTARWQADHLIELLDGWTDAEVPDRAFLQAKSAAYSGYGHLLLGEAMCTAAFDVGEELQPDQIFQRAVDRFSDAISAGQTLGDELLNMARIGRARALLSLGRLPEAQADAELIPAGFVKNAVYSAISLRRENHIFVVNQRSENVTLEPLFRTLNDPRIQVADQGRLTGSGFPVWYQLKYTSNTSPIPIARWEEAQLVIAEAELAAGNLQLAVDAINNVRTRPGVGLPPFSSTDPDEIMDQLVFERQVEFFLESHRLGDIRRYNLPLVPAPGSAYPAGGVYGDDRCMPLPEVERVNNPNVPSS